MENTVLDELLNLFLNDEQEVDGQLSNPPDVVELPDDVVKDIVFVAFLKQIKQAFSDLF